jgi:hypothetical protein
MVLRPYFWGRVRRRSLLGQAVPGSIPGHRFASVSFFSISCRRALHTVSNLAHENEWLDPHIFQHVVGKHIRMDHRREFCNFMSST